MSKTILEFVHWKYTLYKPVNKGNNWNNSDLNI